MDGTKKCPMCAEQIKAEARVCQYCGAEFEVSIKGYCRNCRAVVEADETGRCRRCGGETIDQQLESRPKTSRLMPAPPIQRPSPARQPPPPIQQAYQTPQPQQFFSQPASGTYTVELFERKGEGFNLRFGAVDTDFFIILFLTGILIAILAVMSSTFQASEIFATYAGLIALMFPLIWMFYSFVTEWAFGGTVGKLANGLRVISLKGGRCTWWQAAIRAVFMPLDYNPIGAIVIAATPKKQRIGDLIAGTLVVNRNKASKAEFRPPAMAIDFFDNRRVEFANFSEGTWYKFGMIRDLFLRGVAPDGNPIKMTLSVVGKQADSGKLEILGREIERMYNCRFPEKLNWRRLLGVLIAVPLIFLCIIAGFASGLLG